MQFSTGDTVLRLTLQGYEFPEETEDPWDANWLVVEVQAETAGGAWTATDPALLTREVRHLARWLDQLAAGGGAEELDFLDGAMTCRAERRELPAGITLSFGLYYELAPRWAEKTPFWLTFEPTNAELARAAADLRRQARAWPPRAGW
jgi:hypothetical protein